MDGIIKYWDVRSPSLHREIGREDKPVFNFVISQYNNFLVSGGSSKKVCYWDIDD